jgi:hypothetical protein
VPNPESCIPSAKEAIYQGEHNQHTETLRQPPSGIHSNSRNNTRTPRKNINRHPAIRQVSKTCLTENLRHSHKSQQKRSLRRAHPARQSVRRHVQRREEISHSHSEIRQRVSPKQPRAQERPICPRRRTSTRRLRQSRFEKWYQRPRNHKKANRHRPEGSRVAIRLQQFLDGERHRCARDAGGTA